MSVDHEYFMMQALKEAKLARETGDVPVGCVIVKQDEVVASGRNRREDRHSATAHAEVIAIENACNVLDTWRLSDCKIYVTLEPCPMCAGAIINARIPEVYFAVKDSGMGACGSILNLFEEEFRHHPKIVGGIFEEECKAELQDFFKELRKN